MLIIFSISLLFVYRGLPDLAAVHFDAQGKADGFLPKEQIFYLFGGIVFSMNILVGSIAKLVHKLPVNQPFLKNKGEAEVKMVYAHFFHFFLLLLNAFAAYITRVLIMVNDSRTAQTDFSFLGSLALVFVLILLIYLVGRILILPNQSNK